jgi:AcrR family transcriptional regulator
MTAVAPPGAAPRRRLTAARRRRQLIDVALETFAGGGFNATTMEDIATSAGVTKPLLYQHFASKRALYLELIDDVAERLVTTLADAATAETNWQKQVEAGFEAYFLFAIENQAAVRMLFDAPQDEELARGLRMIEVAIADFVAPLIEADITPEHQRAIAAAIVGMAEGVTREWLRNRGRIAPEVDDPKQEAIRLAHQVAEFAWGGMRGLRRV